jgi:integrase
MTGRRGRSEDSIYYDHKAPCSDPDEHRRCSGSWRGVISLGYGPDGKRIRRKVRGQTKTEVRDKLRDLHSDIEAGIRKPAAVTVQHAAEDWLSHGLDGRSAATVRKNRDVLMPVLAIIGRKRLRELTAADVHSALASAAADRTTATVAVAHNCLTRLIRYAEARDLVRRNVSALVDTPKGKPSRRSRSLTPEQAAALIVAASQDRPRRTFHPGLRPQEPRPAALMHAYIVVSLTVGLRTEEVRALRWDHVVARVGDQWLPVTVTGFDHAQLAVFVWRSARVHDETKTERSRRSLELPRIAVNGLSDWRLAQADDRLAAGTLWQETDLVFTTSIGTTLSAGNVRRMFRDVCTRAGIGEEWTPRELRHSFVSLMSDRGISTEEISRLVGHSSTRTTEVVYRHELRPVLRTGAEAMDAIFNQETG